MIQLKYPQIVVIFLLNSNVKPKQKILIMILWFKKKEPVKVTTYFLLSEAEIQAAFLLLPKVPSATMFLFPFQNGFGLVEQVKWITMAL